MSSAIGAFSHRCAVTLGPAGIVHLRRTITRRGGAIVDTNERDPVEEALRARLERARRRVVAAAPASPEWEAAQAALDALERVLATLRPLTRSGRRVSAQLGPLVLEDGILARGSFAASEAQVREIRAGALEALDRVHSRAEFITELDALTRRAGFVLETAGDDHELVFYAWAPD